MITNAINTSGVRINLLKQTSLCEEVYTKNGSQRPLHIVVKNSPFSLNFGVTSSNQEEIDLHKFSLEVALVYEDAEKEVDFIKTKPIQVKSTINPGGNKLTLEVRIKVLTSQLEDSLFKVAVKATEPTTNATYSGLSDAIRVISKSDQVKKNGPKKEKKKRPITDDLTEYLCQIESTTLEHAQLLKDICTNNDALLKETKGLTMTPVHFTAPVPPPVLSFDVALNQFLNTYNKLDHREKRQRLSNVIRGTPYASTFTELMDLISTEGLQRNFKPNTVVKQEPFAPNVTDSYCSCSGCPYFKELARIETFYDDIFSFIPPSLEHNHQ